STYSDHFIKWAKSLCVESSFNIAFASCHYRVTCPIWSSAAARRLSIGNNRRHFAFVSKFEFVCNGHTLFDFSEIIGCSVPLNYGQVRFRSCSLAKSSVSNECQRCDNH